MGPAESVEIFDVVDEHDQVIGQAARTEVHRRGLRHRAIHVFLFNEAGELFLQKRSAKKDTFPLCFDSSASGHLAAGEDYDDCARRELEEELGLVVRPEQLRRHFKIAACEQTGWEFVWVYSLVCSQPPTINPDEIESGEFWSRQQVRSAIAHQPERFARSFIRVFAEFEQRHLRP